ncbi:MAG: hypothetical protein GY947_02280 [Rhodobacteraceae bacterium]|nr:hypothetical protein [Paracoccaceae bacterium]
MNEMLIEFAARQADAGATQLPETFRQMAVNAQLFLKPRMSGCEVGTNLDKITDFNLNLKRGRITFSFEDRADVTATVQVAGTYSADGSYMWGWGHPSIPEPLQAAAWAVQQFGERQEIEEMLSRGGVTDPKLLDDYLAIAAYISNADGVFVGDHGGGGKVCVCYYLKK